LFTATSSRSIDYYWWEPVAGDLFPLMLFPDILGVRPSDNLKECGVTAWELNGFGVFSYDFYAFGLRSPLIWS